MFQGKKKAVTFSFDDGVTQDKRLIELLDRYGLKGTFNLNSGRLDEAKKLFLGGVTVSHVKPRAEEIAGIYKGHEIAAHSVSHPSLRTLSREEVIREVEQDCDTLSGLAGYEVVGFAYPGGDHCVDGDVVRAVREGTRVKYARRTTATGRFDLPEDWIDFYPTIQCCEFDRLNALAEEFIRMTPDSPKLFYVWGHSFEFDANEDGWGRFERFCRRISGREDTFYGTNLQCLPEE